MWNIRRRMKAAEVAFKQNRAATPQERDDREMNERANASSAWLKEQIERSPLKVWFPSDTESTWIPSFFRAGKDE